MIDDRVEVVRSDGVGRTERSIIIIIVSIIIVRVIIIIITIFGLAYQSCGTKCQELGFFFIFFTLLIIILFNFPNFHSKWFQIQNKAFA